MPALPQKEVCLLSRVLSIFKTDHSLTDKRKEMTCPNVHCPWRNLNVEMRHVESTVIARRKLLQLNTFSDLQPQASKKQQIPQCLWTPLNDRTVKR